VWRRNRADNNDRRQFGARAGSDSITSRGNHSSPHGRFKSQLGDQQVHARRSSPECRRFLDLPCWFRMHLRWRAGPGQFRREQATRHRLRECQRRHSFTVDGAGATGNYFGSARGGSVSRISLAKCDPRISGCAVPDRAEYGGAATGFVNVVTVRRDDLHGNAFYYNRNSGTAQ